MRRRPNVTHLFCWAPAVWSAVRAQAHVGGRADPAGDPDAVHDEVSKLYARVAAEPAGEFHFHRGAAYASRQLRYDPAALAALPKAATDSFAGVGNPHLIDEIRTGEVVLDVGCGAGMDLLLAARRVGDTGRVIGVEMTAEMRTRCAAAIAEAELANVEVRPGDATQLPLDDDSVDVVQSNGVLNLVPDKPMALREILRVLRPGGRLLLSDIALTAGWIRHLRSNIELWALCVGGAVREQELLDLVGAAGFDQPRITERFDCILGTSSEFLARRLGVHGINLYARKPGPVGLARP